MSAALALLLTGRVADPAGAAARFLGRPGWQRRDVVREEDAEAAAVRGVVEAARDVTLAALRQELGRVSVTSWGALMDWLDVRLGGETVESFVVLYLDRKNALIADECPWTGTVDHTPVYIREVAKRALELGASAVIVAHNHPSGDPTPSKADRDITRGLCRGLGLFDIALHDHVVVGSGGRKTSLKATEWALFEAA